MSTPAEKKNQPSRSPEARKARRIIRDQLRLAFMAASGAYTEEESKAMDEQAEAMQPDVDEALAFLATIRRERKPKAEKKSKKSAVAEPSSETEVVVVKKSKKARKAAEPVAIAA